MNFRSSSTLVAALLATSLQMAYAGHTNTVLVTDLDGREEVDDNDPTNRLPGDPNGKGEAYVFGVDGDLTTLCYLLEVENIQLVPVGQGIAAHIHEGVRDSNGPVVAVLAGPEDTNAADCLTEGEPGKFPTGEVGIVQRILNNPELFYINVHNPEFPSGAIRGNLRYQLETEHSHDDESGSPTVPMNLSATVYSATALELFWDRSTDDGVVASYRVYRDNEAVADVVGNSYFAEGLSTGSSYSFSVEAIDADGNSSDRSAMLVVETN